jgi:replication-associated recombination protein RarA
MIAFFLLWDKFIEEARANWTIRKKTILFVDEIHRWNKAQQDALLPHSDKIRGLGDQKTKANEEALRLIALFPNGDSHVALNTLEACGS